MPLITQDMVNGKILEAGTLRMEITATAFPHRERLNRTSDKMPVREIGLRQAYPRNGFLNKYCSILI